jgi:hypothetical protein
MAEYKVPVYIVAEVTKCIGYVECNDLEEWEEKAMGLYESQEEFPTTNEQNDFDMGEWVVDSIGNNDLRLYKYQK